MLETIQQTINGASEVMRVSGRYFRLLSTTAAVTVEIGRGNVFVRKMTSVEAGAWYRVPANEEDFDSLRITTSSSQVVKWVITSGEAGYDRLTITTIDQLPGLIADNADGQAVVGASGILGVLARLQAWNGSTWDRLTSRTRSALKGLVVSLIGKDDAVAAGEAFGVYNLSGATGGQYSHHQIYNPAGSGVVGYIDEITVWCTNANPIFFAFYNTALATSSVAANNKNIGGAVSKCLSKAEAGAAKHTGDFAYVQMLAATPYTHRFDPPLRIEEGEGIIVVPNAVNSDLGTSWQWREKTT